MRIKKRFNALYSLDDIGKINSFIRRDEAGAKVLLHPGMKKNGHLLVWTSLRETQKAFFSIKKLPEKEIEHINNAAEIIFSLFKPQYKVMKEFETVRGSAQIHLNLFTLRHNFRVFARGKRKGFSPVQLEGLNVSLNDWSDLLYSNKVIPEELLFPSGKVKEAIFSESGT